jgi:leucyl/phenylalanyl-tRNA--protein transferase
MVVRELEPDILLGAYASGIFPMADHDGEVSWFSPDPRAILPLDGVHVSRNLQKLCRMGKFEVVVDRDFPAVIRACAEREEGTWISPDFIEAYTRLHEMGFAHSVEARLDGELAGGLYGVHLGGAFCGESMFFRVRDASKVALVRLVERMRRGGFTLLDVQFMTSHLRRFGAVEIPRTEYLRRLKIALSQSCRLAD